MGDTKCKMINIKINKQRANKIHGENNETMKAFHTDY